MARMRIKDIAEQAGVSPATVSRYLNNRPGQMTEETRARIAEVIERTGYRPRTAARNLRREQSRLIGVMFADIRNPYSSAMLEELSALAGRCGYALMTAVSGNDARREVEGLERLVDAGADGLIVNTCGGNDAQIGQIAQQIPMVLLDRGVAGAYADVVTSNNDELMRELVGEVVSGGASKCCLLMEPGDSSQVRRIRAMAFEDECARRGIDGAILSLAPDTEAAALQVASLRGRSGEALGIIAVNGLVFLQLVEALAAHSPALPPEIRIATFDDYAWNHVLYGGVTTAVQDTSVIADAVLCRLVARIERTAHMVGKEAVLQPEHIEVSGTVVRRASTELPDAGPTAR